MLDMSVAGIEVLQQLLRVAQPFLIASVVAFFAALFTQGG